MLFCSAGQLCVSFCSCCCFCFISPIATRKRPQTAMDSPSDSILCVLRRYHPLLRNLCAAHAAWAVCIDAWYRLDSKPQRETWIFQLYVSWRQLPRSLGCLMLRHGHVTGSGNGVVFFCTADDKSEKCLTGISFCWAPSAGRRCAVFSLTGFVCVAKYIGLFFALWVVVHCLRRGIIAPASDFACSILCFVFCHFFVLVITETRYGSDVFESRYHLFWWIAFLLLLVVCLQDFWEKLQNRRLKRCIFTIGYCFLAIFSATGYRQLAFLTHDRQMLCAAFRKPHRSSPYQRFFPTKFGGREIFAYSTRKTPDIRAFRLKGISRSRYLIFIWTLRCN